MKAAPAAQKATAEKEWWLRALLVFQSPSAVFAALRDDSEEQAEARQEPVIALVALAGIASVLALGAAGRLLDQPGVDGILVVVLVFLTGGVYGVASYWLGGGLLHVGLRGAGGKGSYRRSRHLLAFAAAPLALSLLVVWPVRLALYGSDSFRYGGADERTSHWLFDALSAVFAGWSLALLVLGVAVVHRWTLLRALVSLVLTLLAAYVVTIWVVIPLSAG